MSLFKDPEKWNRLKKIALCVYVTVVIFLFLATWASILFMVGDPITSKDFMYR